MNAYVEKNSGRLVRSVTADATFAFHHVNAFADGDGLAVDFIAYPDASAIDQLYLARLRASAPVTATGKLTRFRVPLHSDAPATRRILVDAPIELPRINYESHAEGSFAPGNPGMSTTGGRSASAAPQSHLLP